jgi:Uma2 family endonuclease
MEKTMINPPRTIIEVFKMLPEGSLAEIIDNTLFMSPAPSPSRQRLILSLATQINTFVSSNKLGEIFVSPVDVYLDETSNVVQPDLLLILKGSKVEIDPEGIHGVPDLVIEVLSPGNKKHDTIIKKAIYEKFGVREYWVIDPDTKQSYGYSLVKGAYQHFEETSGKLSSPLLNGTFLF